MESEDKKTQARELTKKYIELTKNEETKQILQDLLSKDSDELIDMMTVPLKLGTGGIRCKMQIGFSYLNDVTVNVIATSLTAYYGTIKNILASQRCNPSDMSKIYIGYDGRYNSEFFALIFAQVFRQELYEIYVTDRPVITPFAIYMSKKGICDISIMITASHNTKEYNGIKIFLDRGCQIGAPFDKELEAYFLDKTTTEIDCHGYTYHDIETKRNDIVDWTKIEGIHLIDFETCLDGYCKDFCNSWNEYALSIVQNDGKEKILLSMLNGPSCIFMKKMIELYALQDSIVVYEPHCNIDPEFASTIKPNPEKRESYKEPIKYADEHSIKYIFMFDPDGDRFGMATKNDDGWKFLQSDEIATLILSTSLQLFPTEKIIVMNTIYCNDLIKKICHKESIRYYQVETGFKNISSKLLMKKEKHNAHFVLAYEDSLGFAIGDGVEKDALPCAVFMAKIVQNTDVPIDFILEMTKQTFGVFVTYKKQIICDDPRAKMDEYIKMFNDKMLNFTIDDKKVTVKLAIRVYLRISETENIIKVYSNTSKCTYEDLKLIVDGLLNCEE